MTYLFDTHVLIWTAHKPEKLSPKMRELITSDIDRAFSLASIWEIAIKYRLGREDFTFEPREFRQMLFDNAFRELAITGEDVTAVSDLPLIHGDPFDRMLVVQASNNGVTLLTADRQIAANSGPILYL